MTVPNQPPRSGKLGQQGNQVTPCLTRAFPRPPACTARSHMIICKRKGRWHLARTCNPCVIGGCRLGLPGRTESCRFWSARGDGMKCAAFSFPAYGIFALSLVGSASPLGFPRPPTLYPSSLQLPVPLSPLSPSPVTTFPSSSLSCSPLPRPPSPSPAVWLRHPFFVSGE